VVVKDGLQSLGPVSFPAQKTPNVALVGENFRIGLIQLLPEVRAVAAEIT